MTWTHPVYEAVARFVGSRTGLRLSSNHRDRAERAIRHGMERSRITSPEAYHELLKTDEDALDDLVGELTVGETYFFREPGQFEFIRREVLSDLRRRRGSAHVFRVWSAGCATGEEAYSLAMLFEREGLGERTRVLATDISRAALARGQQATYKSWSLRGTGAAAALPYLSRRGEDHALDDKIRRRVRFEYLNLAQDVYPSLATDTWSMDLILCRNVLIYLDGDTVDRVALRLFQSLAPGGWLIAASSDPPLQDRSPFATVMTNEGLFYRRPLEGDVKTGRQGDKETRRQGDKDSSDSPSPPLPVSAPAGLPVSSLPPGSGSLSPEQRTESGRGDRRDAAAHVRALAAEDVAEAKRTCATEAARQPLNAELHYLHAVLLMDLNREEEAMQSLRRVLYLDRSLAVAHFTLASLLWRRGDRAGARSAFRNTFALCSARPAQEMVPLADGECAGRLARSAAFHLTLLDAGEEAAS